MKPINIINKLNESATEEYWDAEELDRRAFTALLRFYKPDSKGNKYIITNDNNELVRFNAPSDEEAIEIFKTKKYVEPDFGTLEESDKYEVAGFDKYDELSKLHGEYNVKELSDDELYKLYNDIKYDIETGQWSSEHTLLPEIEEELEKRGIEPINEGINASEGVDWSYFNKFDKYDEPYLPASGEGETKATQAVTASTKLVYKWYNDGDVYDNSYYLDGWANDLSSYANWLAKYIDGAKPILDRIKSAHNDGEYEEILKDLCDLIYTDEFLSKLNEQPKEGSVYDCDGDYEFNPNKYDEEEEEEW